MKILLQREAKQASGRLGKKKPKFTLYVRGELTTEERQLIDDFDLEDFVIARWVVRRDKGVEMPGQMRARSLVEGKEITCESFIDVCGAEMSVKEGCEQLKAVLADAQTFAGEEAFEL